MFVQFLSYNLTNNLSITIKKLVIHFLKPKNAKIYPYFYLKVVIVLFSIGFSINFFTKLKVFRFFFPLIVGFQVFPGFQVKWQIFLVI